MLKLNWSLHPKASLFAIACAVIVTGAHAEPCVMEMKTLAKTQMGPLDISVIGTPVFCINEAGDANLRKFTATAKIVNAGTEPVTVTHYRTSTPAFTSTKIWDRGHLENKVAFMFPRPLHKTEVITETLAPNEHFLITSWSRHQNFIWRRTRNGKPTRGAQVSVDRDGNREFTVNFYLGLSYSTGNGPEISAYKEIEVDFVAIKEEPPEE